MIIDDILEHSKKHDMDYYTLLKERLKNAVFVRVQNIADYFFMGNDQENWDIEKDFPNCAPPWRKFWMEWKSPPKIISKERGILDVPVKMSFGVLISAEDAYDVPLESSSQVKNSNIGWALVMNYFMISNQTINPLSYFLGASNLFVSKDGKPTRFLFNRDGDKRLELFAVNKKAFLEEQGGSVCDFMSATIRPVVLLAISFCHCKNTEVQQNLQDQKLIKKRNERGRFPINKYYTLEIGGMKKILNETGNKTDIKKALHICRGHFKDFRGTKGLFGKHHDLYWWDMHSRGSSERGEVKKDYEVKTAEVTS